MELATEATIGLPAAGALIGVRVRNVVGIPGIILSLLLLFPISAYPKKPILVFRPEGKAFDEVVMGLEKEIGDEYAILAHLVAERSGAGDMDSRIRQVKPKLIVLMDNRTINLYRKYQGSLADSAAVTPSISLMAAFLEKEIMGLTAAAGISYEIPIVTSALNLRTIIKRPIPKVGVVHREFLRNFIAENTGYCKREGIGLAAVSLGNREANYRKSVKKALDKLFEEEKIDALWIPNDNVLLSPEIIKDVWIPIINKFKKPVIVGVETLVNPKLSFGTFAVIPDHLELGRQLAEKILEISNSNFDVGNGTVNQPLSVIKTINLRQARKFLNLGTDGLGSVDKVLE